MKLLGESNLCPSLTPAERAAQLVQNEPMIMHMKKLEAEKQVQVTVIKIVANILAIKALKDISEKDEDFIIDYVSKTLLESFTTYRLSEIQQACEMWARGELFSDKDLNLLSAENIFKAIHRYGEKVKRESNHKQRQYFEKLAKETEELERTDKINEFERLISEKYLNFPESLKNDNYGTLASYYRHLDKKNIVDISLEKKKEIFKEAEAVKEADKNLAEQLFQGIKIEYTAREIAEANALKYAFEIWKFEDYELNFKQV